MRKRENRSGDPLNQAIQGKHSPMVVGIVTDGQGGEVLESIRSKLSAAERSKFTTSKDAHIFNIGDAYAFFQKFDVGRCTTDVCGH